MLAPNVSEGRFSVWSCVLPMMPRSRPSASSTALVICIPVVVRERKEGQHGPVDFAWVSRTSAAAGGGEAPSSGTVPGDGLSGALRRADAAHAARSVVVSDRRPGQVARLVELAGVPEAAHRDGDRRHQL